LGWAVAAVVGLPGSEEHPAIDININPAARIATATARFLIVIFRSCFFVCESLYWKRTENCRAGYGAPESTHDFLS
jgi:hypothetical protein